MKRKIAVTMAMLMACSSVVPTFGAVTFKDIDDVPWQGAQTFINRAGELEIMVGEVVDGEPYFRGKDNVTCFETVQLVYSMLDKTGNLKSTEGVESKWSYVMKQLSVPEWAYPCISYSLEYGIVSMSEVGKFTNASKGTPTYATREAAAVILGKAMSDKYTLDTDAKLSFSDASSVNDTSVQYVELLARLEIFLGDYNNNFNPKVAINRAEMATIITKAYDKMNTGSSNNEDNNNSSETEQPSTGTTIAAGSVISVNDMGSSYLVTILKSDGDKIGLFASSSTTVTNIGGGTSTYTALSAGDTLKDITYSGADIKSLTITYDADPGLNQNIGKVEGTIDEIYNDIVYINKSTGGTAKYYINVNCDYILDGKIASQKDIFDAYKKGRVDVSVSLNVKGEATKLDCTTKESDYMYGELRSISRSGLTIKKSGRTYTTDYSWINGESDDVDFYLEGKNSSYTDVRDAFDSYSTTYVKYVTDSRDDVKRLYVSKYDFEDTSSSDGTYKGTINDVSRRYVNFKKSGSSSYKEYNFKGDDIDNATLKIDGKTYDYYDFRDKLDSAGTLSVTIEVNSKDEVTRITATTTSSSDTSGVIKSMTSSTIAIGSSSNKYDIASGVSVSIDGNSDYNIDDLRKFVDDRYITMEANLTIKSSKVTKIEAHIKSVEGDLRYFDSRRGELEVRTPDRTTMAFDFKTSTLNVKGDERSVDDLEYYMNDKGREYEVVVEVDPSNGYASTITVTEI